MDATLYRIGVAAQKSAHLAYRNLPKQGKMLYYDKALGRAGLARRLAAWVTARSRRRRLADLDLLSMNAHLRRDLGIEHLPPHRFSDGDVFRK
jgi:hypothetical protein